MDATDGPPRAVVDDLDDAVGAGRSSRKLRGWLHAGTFPLAAGRRHRAGRPRRRHATSGRAPPSSPRARRCCSASARSTTAATGRPRVRALLQAPRPLQHLPAHRRAPTRRSASSCCATARPARCCCGSSGRPRCCGVAVPGVLGRRAALALHAGLPRRSAGSRCSTSATCSTPVAPRWSTLLAVGGVLYTLGGVVYGHQEAEPVTAVVRLPRGLPRPDDRGVHLHYVAVSLATYS